MHNNYEHDENCLINVPIAGMSLWRKGFADQKTGKATEVSPGPSGILYTMGVRCAERVAAMKTSAERTTKSLEQAVEIARTR